MKQIYATVTAGKDGYGVWLNDYPISSAATKVDELKASLREAIELTLEVNETLKEDFTDYEIVYTFDASALIKYYGDFLGYPALHKITGVNSKQLWNYANAGIHPRKDKASQILDSLRYFGKELNQIQISF
ncbi:hypothetical protein LJC44_04060 [Parabacteroides sp. OttesenSCG-928-G06]|nr:hypothetical protein [Parabacteroides sp. OttesenSCG-928-G06]